MANIKSQIKRNKTNEKARLRNRAVKSELKTYVRKVRTAASAGDADGAAKVFKLIDALEDSDDVQNVYSNMDVPEDVLASLDV